LADHCPYDTFQGGGHETSKTTQNLEKCSILKLLRRTEWESLSSLSDRDILLNLKLLEKKNCRFLMALSCTSNLILYMFLKEVKWVFCLLRTWAHELSFSKQNCVQSLWWILERSSGKLLESWKC
jgi:hypothetical protein